MTIFENPFFSIAGQEERLANVGNTLLSAVGINKGGVQSNTGVDVVDNTLSTVASHPFITAGVATIASLPISTTLSAAGEVASTLGKKFLGAGLKNQALIVGGSLVGVPALVKSEKLRNDVVNAPSSLVNFGSNVGNVIDNPTLDNATNVFKENPLVAGAIAATAVISSGVGIGTVISVWSNHNNTKAVNNNTDATLRGLQNGNSNSGNSKSDNSGATPASNIPAGSPVSPSVDSKPLDTVPPVVKRSVSPNRKHRLNHGGKLNNSVVQEKIYIVQNNQQVNNGHAK